MKYVNGKYYLIQLKGDNGERHIYWYIKSRGKEENRYMRKGDISKEESRKYKQFLKNSKTEATTAVVCQMVKRVDLRSVHGSMEQ